MSDKPIHQYQVFCISEGSFITVYGTEEPTLCPNDHADRSINPDLTSIVETYDVNKIKAEENTEGDFTHATIENEIPAGTPGDVTDHDDAVWSENIYLWKTVIYPSDDMMGDVINVRGIKNDPPNYNIVGALTADGTAGTNVLTVSDTAVENVYKGLEIVLDNSIITENVGYVTSIDTVAKTITVQKNLTSTFSSGSLVRVEQVVIKDCKIHSTKWPIEIGGKGLKGKKIQAGDIMRVRYTNNDGQAKKVYWDAEYYNLDSVTTNHL